MPYSYIWSMACGAMLLAGSAPAHAVDSTAVFNEVMYHPATPSGVEWIELHNQMAINLDLSGWRITGAVDYTFPAGTTLNGGGYVVITGTAGAPVAGAIGPWTGLLDNDEGTLRLRNVAGRIMDELNWKDRGRWPSGPDGSGATLAKVSPGGSGAAPEAWLASREISGTPGLANFTAGVPAPGIRINEISGAADPVFQVELKNDGPTSLAMSGLSLGSFALPATSLAPGAFVVFDETQLGFRPLPGDRVFLLATRAGS
jgi:hypothetical protein